MAKKTKKSVLPRIEVIIVLVFFLSFIMWAMSQCSAKKLSYTDETEEPTEGTTENSPVGSIISELTESNSSSRPTSEANRQATSANGQNTGTPPRPVATPRVETVYATKLYVTIDGLKFRTGPSMDSTILLILPLDQELEFMNEVTDSTQVISLGNGVMANERWIKVRHWKGHEGWVYGAGVNYFKTTPSQ